MFVMNNNEYVHPDPDENLQPRTLIYWFSPNNPLKHKTSISGLINSIQVRIHSEYSLLLIISVDAVVVLLMGVIWQMMDDYCNFA